MTDLMRLAACAAAFLLICPTALSAETTATAAASGDAATTSAPHLLWFKGNTHTHTTNSDGDSSPSVVARWYRDHHYDFLVLTDHNKRTEIDELQAEIAEENRQKNKKPFLLIPGEEVSDMHTEGERKYALHTNALGTTVVVGKQGGPALREILQKCIDAIHQAGGIPSVNHPNFMWSLTTDDLYSMRSLRHFEIYNGHPHVNNLGGGGVPGTEQIWDDLLSRGRLYFGVAVDDAHNYKKFDRLLSNPGRGWVVVRAPALTPRDILDAFNRGDFYASTGVELDDVSVSNKTLRIRIGGERGYKFRTEFIGKNGTVLKVDETMEPSYQLAPGDLYVRAKVTSSAGDHAWTQPLYADDTNRLR